MPYHKQFVYQLEKLVWCEISQRWLKILVKNRQQAAENLLVLANLSPKTDRLFYTNPD